MSTFKGIIAEFPQIRIDYFRHQPEHKSPLACFLSHVHSDHLVGLESLRAPFVYCSAATRELLLRLEKYHYRMNFARGILESRTVTYDRSMRRLAKPLPLDTPTIIELSPGNTIRVTLLDANHCVGAVMFLIEGNGKAVLYTGDIRAETWWVNSIVQNPVILPYTCGSRRLDCIYLDTTFATKSSPYREFPSKADGIRELLEKVAKYPDDTIFYFHSWTFGYENVWIALSAFLNAHIHLDRYRYGIYKALSSLKTKQLRESGHDIREAPALCGYMNGNHFHPGCLTSDTNVRLHSCERGAGCPVVDHDTAAKVVHIMPIITRTGDAEIAEIGAGGGQGDLDQKDELETADVGDVGKLITLCAEKIEDQELLSKVLAVLQHSLNDKSGMIDLGQGLQKESESQQAQDNLPVQALVSVLSEQVTGHAEYRNETIRFPYSRHSSYSELCTLVDALKPKDVYPCTVDEDTWTPEVGMRSLFGSYCSADIFRHDAEMMDTYESRMEREARGKREADTQTTEDGGDAASPVTSKKAREVEQVLCPEQDELVEETVFVEETATPSCWPGRNPSNFSAFTEISEMQDKADIPEVPPQASTETNRIADSYSSDPVLAAPPATDCGHAPRSPARLPSCPGSYDSKKRSKNKFIAYNAAMGIGLSWSDLGGLVSTRKEPEQEELEL
ncbi:uncharacterized protein EI97DRAFT_383564 [Westerdykella ornata]|uniref:Protein artemis n=1 Tax=Westerdykella ornata TaxID=318751 RepID=A0A6A6JB22_WESOR|nr:uncharacterized protein EI97DRAFT_383564 [Westerdykella ornata]KAF2273485.1 hypothetical protein EI97DRAFT_383564 [Westerdykella ornata]